MVLGGDRTRTGGSGCAPRSGWCCPPPTAAETLADLFGGTDVTVELDPDFISAAWHKLLVNAVVGLMVLTGRRMGMFRRDDVAALARRYSRNASRSRAPMAPVSVTR